MSEKIEVPYVLNSSCAIDPTVAYEDDAGFDMYAELLQDVIIPPLSQRKISTGIKFAMPKRSRAILHDKSGIAEKLGLTVLGGVIDSNYRGVVNVLLYNTSPTNHVTIHPKQKIVQILFEHNLPVTLLTKK